MQAAEESGQFTYVPPSSPDDDNDKLRTGVTLPVSTENDVHVSHSSSAPETDHVKQKMVCIFVIYKRSVIIV